MAIVFEDRIIRLFVLEYGLIPDVFEILTPQKNGLLLRLTMGFIAFLPVIDANMGVFPARTDAHELSGISVFLSCWRKKAKSLAGKEKTHEQYFLYIHRANTGSNAMNYLC